MTDDVIGVIAIDDETHDVAPFEQCGSCGRVIYGACSVCPSPESPHAERDPLETERYRAELRRVDRMNALRPGERI